jgi:hypothetical protein
MSVYCEKSDGAEEAPSQDELPLVVKVLVGRQKTVFLSSLVITILHELKRHLFPALCGFAPSMPERL